MKSAWYSCGKFFPTINFRISRLWFLNVRKSFSYYIYIYSTITGWTFLSGTVLYGAKENGDANDYYITIIIAVIISNINDSGVIKRDMAAINRNNTIKLTAI